MYIHRDIKPDNFRIHDHKVKLIDFGLCKKIVDKNGYHEIRK